MKRLRPFELVFPTSVGEAVAVLAGASEQTRVLAGGTDLLVDMKLGRVRPSLVVDLKRIPGLTGIVRTEGGIRIGALTPVAAMAASSLIRGGCRAVHQAAGVLGSPPIRQLATIGGNLGRGSPASDLTPALMVCGATVTVAGPGAEREIPVEGLFIGPGATSLRCGEIITTVLIPDAFPRTGSAHLKLGRRGGGWDLALVGVAASLTLAADGTVAAARIALGSVGPTVLRSRGAEGCLQGRVPDEAALEAAAEAAAAEARPISDVRATGDYRRELTGVLTLRALRAARGAALGEGPGP